MSSFCNVSVYHAQLEIFVAPSIVLSSWGLDISSFQVIAKLNMNKCCKSRRKMMYFYRYTDKCRECNMRWNTRMFICCFVIDNIVMRVVVLFCNNCGICLKYKTLILNFILVSSLYCISLFAQDETLHDKISSFSFCIVKF